VSPETDPYERLAAIAEQELALVSAFALERVGELVALAQQRTTLVASLPARPPASARAALARAAALQERTTAALSVLVAELGRDLNGVDRARRAARGYGMGLPEPRPVLDHVR